MHKQIPPFPNNFYFDKGVSQTMDHILNYVLENCFDYSLALLISISLSNCA